MTVAECKDNIKVFAEDLIRLMSLIEGTNQEMADTYEELKGRGSTEEYERIIVRLDRAITALGRAHSLMERLL